MLIKDLTEFGLSEKEAKVYLSLLSLEVAPVSEIAKSAGINRSTTYVTLEALKQKGYVSTTDDKNIQKFVATEPEALLRTAENLAEKYSSIKKNIERLVPELNALHKDTKQRPKVRVFEGKEGLINVFEDTLYCREKLMRVCSSAESHMKTLPDYFPTYVKKRLQRGIIMHGIHPDDESGKMFVSHKAHFDQPVLIPKNKYKFSADIAIYDNKIGYMFSDKGDVAIIIESKEISDVMKSVFDLAWEEAKRLHKKYVEPRMKKLVKKSTQIE